jgi:hypothetical protein
MAIYVLESRQIPAYVTTVLTGTAHKRRGSASSSGGRRGGHRDGRCDGRRDGRRGTGRCPDSGGPCPIGDRDQHGRDLRPNILHKTALRRGEVRPIEPPHTAVASNNRHATYSDFRLDTNNRRHTRNPDRGSEAQREPHGDVAADQF